METAPPFTGKVVSRNGVVSIALFGELDLATVPTLEHHLATVDVDGVAAIMLDLGGVTFLDCTAVRAFLAARDRAEAKGRRLSLVGANRLARRLLELTGTQFLLDEGERTSGRSRGQ
jgi:anti-sigma B factor antagonist